VIGLKFKIPSMRMVRVECRTPNSTLAKRRHKCRNFERTLAGNRVDGMAAVIFVRITKSTDGNKSDLKCDEN